jgi:hypothetical protein
MVDPKGLWGDFMAISPFRFRTSTQCAVLVSDLRCESKLFLGPGRRLCTITFGSNRLTKSVTQIDGHVSQSPRVVARRGRGMLVMMLTINFTSSRKVVRPEAIPSPTGSKAQSVNKYACKEIEAHVPLGCHGLESKKELHESCLLVSPLQCP